MYLDNCCFIECFYDIIHSASITKGFKCSLLLAKKKVFLGQGNRILGSHSNTSTFVKSTPFRKFSCPHCSNALF